jgi:hypothetical protein
MILAIFLLGFVAIFSLYVMLSGSSKNKRAPTLSLREWKREFAICKEREEDEEDGLVDDKLYDFYTVGKSLFHRPSGTEIIRPKYTAYTYKTVISDRNKFKIDKHFDVAGFFAKPGSAQELEDWSRMQTENPISINVRLQREPDNPHDPNAIMLMLSGSGMNEMCVGYLPKDIAEEYQDSLPIVIIDRLFEGEELSGKILIPRSAPQKVKL